MKCSECGANNTDEAKFCGICGCELVVVSTKSDSLKKKSPRLAIIMVVSLILIAAGFGVVYAILALNNTENQGNNSRSTASVSIASATDDNFLDTEANDNSRSELPKGESNETDSSYLAGKTVACFEDKYIYLEDKSLKVFDLTTDSNKTLVKNDINCFLSDGTSIYYSQKTNASSDIDLPSDCTINCINSDGTDMRELFTTNSYGEPLAFCKGKLYFTEYKQDYQGFADDVLALYSYDLATKDKQLIQSNICYTGTVGNKIVYISKESSNPDQYNLSYYDAFSQNDTIVITGQYFLETKTRDDIITFILYSVDDNLKATYQVYWYDFQDESINEAYSFSGEGYVSNLVSYGDYVVYSIHDNQKDKTMYYRMNLKSGDNDQIKGLDEKQYYYIYANDEDVYFYIVKGTSLQLYPLKDDEDSVSDELSRVHYGGTEVLLIQEGSIYIKNENGIITRFEVDPQ